MSESIDPKNSPPFEPNPMHRTTVWNYLSWSPTSLLKAHTAEHRLLSRMPFFKSNLLQPIATETRAPKSITKCVSSTTIDDTTIPIPAEAEALVVEAVNKNITARIGQVAIGDDKFINTLFIQNKLHTTRQDTNSTLVMTHGYGAGLGFYYRCFPGLAQQPGWKIYAIDWLGMGKHIKIYNKLILK